MTIASYAGSLSGGLVYEDRVEQPPITESFVQTLHVAMHHPLRSLPRVSRWFDAEQPRRARTVNLSLHLVNGALVGLVALSLLEPAGAVVAAAVFWLHPMQSEAVAYVAARGELLAATVLLLALLAILRRRVLLAGGLVAAGLLTREMAVVGVLLVPWFAWWTGQRWARATRLWWASSAIVLAVLVIAIASHRGIGPYGATEFRYLSGQLTALGALLSLLIVAPVHVASLTIDHDWRWITGYTAVIGLTLWIWAWMASARHHWPWIGFALAWSVLAVLPRLVLPLADGLHERHLYLPMIAWSLAAGAAAQRLPRWSWMGVAIAAWIDPQREAVA